MALRVVFLLLATTGCNEIDSTIESDTGPMPLEEYFASNSSAFHAVRHTIERYYPGYDVDACRIDIIEGDYSRFDVNSDMIRLARKHQRRSVRVIAHEISHLALASLTNRQNLQENHRFFDEGFANIVGHTAANTLADYQLISIHTAVEQFRVDNLSLEKVQDWDRYYDRYGERNRYAYLVGSSFNFFIIDTYGLNSLYDFFADVSVSQNVLVSIGSVWNMDVDEFERRWIEYLLEQDAETTAYRRLVGRNRLSVPGASIQAPSLR